MTTHLVKKYETAKRILQTQGVRAVIQECFAKMGSRVFKRKIDRWAEKWVRGIDNPWLGRVIEAQGNIVRIEGCAFSVDHPAITTEVKSRFLFGRYERPERRALKKYLDPALPVVEFGAAIGVVACLTNKRLDNPKRHVVVEANPDLLSLLEENRERNDCQFTILHGAVAHGRERVTFNQCQNYLGSSVQAVTEKSVDVRATTLAEVLDNFAYERCSLVCDIEGGEADLVRYEAELLAHRVQTLIVEVHPWLLGETSARNVISDLERLGFANVYQEDNTHVMQNCSR